MKRIDERTYKVYFSSAQTLFVSNVTKVVLTKAMKAYEGEENSSNKPLPRHYTNECGQVQVRANLQSGKRPLLAFDKEIV
jgi:hypothetical protein